tara:strand:- start:115 stop:291 length:177 start_codon:yes stop_codon:yes gene_type:complete
MTDGQKKMIEECIQAHHNMIKYHRRAIVDLKRKIICGKETEMQPLDIKFADKETNEGK